MSGDIAAYALKADLLGAYAVRAGAEAGLLDRLRTAPRSVDELAADGFHRPALTAVLAYLGSVEIVEVHDGRWRLTDAATTFLTPLMVRALSLSGTGTRIDRAGNALGDALRHGGVPYAMTYGTDFWSDLARNPAEQEAFHEHLERITSGVGREIAALIGQRGFAAVNDLAGGRGTLAAAISEALPEAVVTVVEQPSMARIAESMPWFGRVRLEVGDLFADRFPAADLHVLCQVLHDWDDERATAILGNVHRSMRPGDRLWVVERTAVAGDPAVFGGSSLRMYVLFGASERTGDEYATLARKAGFDLVSATALAGGFHVLELGLGGDT